MAKMKKVEEQNIIIRDQEVKILNYKNRVHSLKCELFKERQKVTQTVAQNPNKKRMLSSCLSSVSIKHVQET